ncbi:MAG: hypothetical protein IJB09_00870 [Oscillospiraceae bacterium]|nr:hypothetical protein [Oscillospiraceae bacterium]
MEKLSSTLKIAVAVATVLLLAFLAWSCVDMYLAGSSAENLTESGLHIYPVFSRDAVAARLRPLLPWTVAYIGLLCVCTAVTAKDKVKRNRSSNAAYARAGEGKNTGLVRMVLLAAAILFILLGVMNGGAGDVLIKAKNICTECIGLG